MCYVLKLIMLLCLLSEHCQLSCCYCNLLRRSLIIVQPACQTQPKKFKSLIINTHTAYHAQNASVESVEDM